MKSRLPLLALASLTVPLSAQQAGATIGQQATSRIVLPNGAMVMPSGASSNAPGAASGPGGEVDFNKLRELIEQSKNRPAPTPDQQKLAILQQLKFDRSTAGILETRLEEARLGDTPKEEPEVAPEPVPKDPKGKESKVTEKDAKAREEMAQFQKDAAVFRRDVVLGRWEKVRDFLAAQPESNAGQIYEMIVGKLSGPSQVQPPPELLARGAKVHNQSAFLPPADLLGLIAAAPVPLQKKQIEKLAKLLPSETRPPKEFFDTLGKGIPNFGGEEPESRTRAAEFLLESGFTKEAGDFLPDLAEAREKKEYLALNLIARHRAELVQKDKKAAGKDALQLAWELSTSFLSEPKAPAPAKAEALFRALSLIPELGDDTGKQWLDKTFKNPQGEGLEILASLGTLTAQTRENPDEALRLEQLKLQHSAVKTMLATDDVDPADWAGIFTLYARQWSHEAEVTQEKDQSNSRRMVAQYDSWGNRFYSSPTTGYNGTGVRPIAAGELLDCQPDGKWLETIEASTRNECLLSSARLLLKVKEENKALPIIQKIAATDREQAESLVRETIRVWTENHNPNDGRDYRSQYMYFYGYNNQAGAIPLTRSKQERNLVELAALVKGIAGLKLGETFHAELAEAFISCHSQAEVWRVEAVESVFGATDVLDSNTLGTLVGKMRLNLAGLWPNPKLQQAYQTKRKDKELQEQLIVGYQAAQGVLERASLKKPAESWRLEEQLAALRFEESNYRSTLESDHEHTKTKRTSLDELASAAKSYASGLPLNDESKETTSVFETWFFAALGSPSLEALKSHHVATPDEYPKIKAALNDLPESCKDRHLKAFATTINNRLANVAPDLKLRYLEAAAAVVGEHEAMSDGTEVLAYYRDLITEIELDATIDGPDLVGSGSPFGLRVNLRHTREIEREAGGFQKYLQNQTNSPYAWNFGRPTEDYRDKFEKAARAALEEHFEVVSLTFHSDKVESLTDPEFGWRLTPYAYILLKAKGPQVDKVPPLKIDLDFNDTSGYVVLPVTSAEVLIDAGIAEPRPFRELKVTQTLDERSHSEKGNLYLEVKAEAHGLIPPLGELLDQNIDGFEVGHIEDRDLQVVELDAAAEDLAPLSEHEWRIELKPNGGVLPASFHFPTVKPEVAEEDGLMRLRYVDVDLIPADEEVALGGAAKRMTPRVIAGIAALIALLGAAVVWLRRKKVTVDDEPDLLPLPVHINAVSVIGYLRRLQQRDGIAPALKSKIGEEIDTLEARYFGPKETPQDSSALEELARRWQAA